MKERKGFTLIELLVVISIIGMLSSIVLVSVNTARASGRDAARAQAASQVKNALELYYSDYKTYPAGGTTIEALVSGPLNPYLKSLPTNFAVTGGTATSYLSDGARYELLLQMETGSFSKSNGCFAGDYSSYAPTNKYCQGNAPTTSLAGNGGTTTFTPPNGTTNTVFVVPRLNGYVNTGVNCVTTVTFNYAPSGSSQSTAGCYRTIPYPVNGFSYQVAYNSNSSGYTFAGVTPAYSVSQASSPGGPINTSIIIFYVDFTN